MPQQTRAYSCSLNSIYLFSALHSIWLLSACCEYCGLETWSDISCVCQEITRMTSHTQACAPESPRPFSVISETYQKQLILPNYPETSLYSFGQQYEKKLLNLVHRFLELGTDDRLCYVGVNKGSVAPLIQQHFCLLEKMLCVLPDKKVENEKQGEEEEEEELEEGLHVAYTGAEEYFRGVTQHPQNMPLFDRVLVKDCVQYFNNPKQIYKDIMNTLSFNGKIMIIQRPHNMNTLPIFTDAKSRFADIEDPYITIIKDLQNLGYDIQWEVECLPIVMKKTHWLKMLENHFPPQMELVSSNEVKNGSRELSEGVLKYEGEYVEFQDRLLFVTARRPLVKGEENEMRRLSGSKTAKRVKQGPLNYKMKVSDDIAQYVPNQKRY